MKNINFIDLKSSQNDYLEKECEVCIVGAGAAGIYLATEFAKKGIDTVLIEAGGKSTANANIAAAAKRQQDIQKQKDKAAAAAAAAAAADDTMTAEEKMFSDMNLQDGDFDARDHAEDDSKTLSADHLALAFKGKGKGKGGKKKKKGRPGKGKHMKAPCKFWALGQCSKGRDCPYFHSQKQFERRAGGIAAVVPP